MTKIIWWKLCLICSVITLAACSDDETSTEILEICPFKNAVLQQTTAKAGDLISITGEGFARDLNLYFRSELYKFQIANPEVASDGKQINFTVPDLDGDIYKVIIEQEGEWSLNELLTIEKNYVEVTTKRKLLAFTYDNGISGSRNIHYDFRFTWQGDSLISVQQAENNDDNQLSDYFSIDYSTNGYILFKANEETVNPSSGNTGWTDYFTIVPDGNRVKTVIREGAPVNNWEYSGDGYLQVAHNTATYANGYVYNSGNLTTWDYSNSMILPTYLVYDDNNQVNLMGIDFGALYAITMISNSLKTPEFYAHLMRLTGKASTLLPSGVRGRSWNYTQAVFGFEYQTDAEGFVTEASSIQYSYYIDTTSGNLVELDATKKFTFVWETTNQ